MSGDRVDVMAITEITQKSNYRKHHEESRNVSLHERAALRPYLKSVMVRTK